MCETCQNWARTDGMMTNHHPDCPHYNDSLVTVFKVSDGSSSFITESREQAESDMAKDIECGCEGLVLTEEKMHREILDNLPEFDGF